MKLALTLLLVATSVRFNAQITHGVAEYKYISSEIDNFIPKEKIRFDEIVTFDSIYRKSKITFDKFEVEKTIDNETQYGLSTTSFSSLLCENCVELDIPGVDRLSYFDAEEKVLKHDTLYQTPAAPKKIGNYNCENVRFLIDDTVQISMWYTKDIKYLNNSEVFNQKYHGAVVDYRIETPHALFTMKLVKFKEVKADGLLFELEKDQSLHFPKIILGLDTVVKVPETIAKMVTYPKCKRSWDDLEAEIKGTLKEGYDAMDEFDKSLMERSVTISVTIDEKGGIEEIKSFDFLSSGEMIKIFEKLLKNEKWTAATFKGKPVKSFIEIECYFKD